MFKFKVGDKVIITSGKDKGKTSKIIKVIPDKNKVVVDGVGVYTRHLKKMGDQAGQKVQRLRPVPTAKIAILNKKNKPDRVGFKIDKKGAKTRIFKKTGQVVPEPKQEKK